MIRIFLQPTPVSFRHCRSSSVLVGGGRLAARRPTTSAAQWRLKFKHLTTLFYSSIIATAAAADATAKQRRSEQWAKVIHEAEKSLEEVKMRAATPNSGELQEYQTVHTPAADVRTLEDWIRSNASSIPATLFNFPFDIGNVHQRPERLPRNERSSLPNATNSRGNGAEIPYIPETSRVSPGSIYASAFRRATWRQTNTPKKTLTLELSIAKLTTHFLLYALRTSQQSSASFLRHIEDCDPVVAQILTGQLTLQASEHCTGGLANSGRGSEMDRKCDDVEIRIKDGRHASKLRHTLEQRLQQIENQLNMAKGVDAENSVGLATVDFPQYGLDGDENSTHSLNYALVILTNKHGRGELGLEETLAKISYNLLVSRYAPTCSTYNILMSAFSRLRLHGLVDKILSSFLESHVRPNEMIATTILVHYARKYDRVGFNHFVERLQGYHGGPMLARRDVTTDGVGSSRLYEMNGKVIQLLKFDPHMYRSVIAGFLVFDIIDSAMEWYRQMLDDNILPNIFLFTSFLKYFSRQRDWERAWGVWTNIEKRSRDEELDTGFVDAKALLSAYRAILELCERLGKHEHHERILQDAQARGFSNSSLKPQRPVPRAFTRKLTVDKRMDPEFVRRNVRILTHRATLIVDDLRAWALHVLASKFFLHGLDVDSAYAAFNKYADDDAFKLWMGERPWLRMARSLAFKSSDRTDDGQYVEQRVFRFGDARHDSISLG